MELKECVSIFKKHIKTFLVTVVLVLIGGLVLYLAWPVNFKASLTLNVTRLGTQETDSYKYDDFYRLQADEKFSDTVVRWLGSPRIATNILNDAGITTSGMGVWKISGFFKAQRLSSQLIQVTYYAFNAPTAQKISNSVVKILDRQTEELNKFQREITWFKVLGSDPVIMENKLNLSYVMLLSLALGIFLGVWAVFIRHYLE